MTSLWTWLKRLAPILGLALFLVALDAEAGRRRGGSFGSRGGFGRSRSSSSSSSKKSASGGNYSGRRGGGGFFFFGGMGGGSGHGCSGGAASLVSIIVLLIIVVVVIYVIRKVMAAARGKGGGAHGEPKATVLKLQLGLFSIAKEVQDELNRLARSGQVGNSEGEAALLRGAALSLMRKLDAARYGSLEKVDGLSMSAAEARFGAMATNERAKYDIEGVRADEGGVLEDGKRPDEAFEVSEYVVATLIVATTLNEPFKNVSLDDAEQARAALQQIASIPAMALLGMEVIWVPDDPQGVLTEDDLLMNWPELSSM
jgi:uncharacterized membrane protein